MENAPALRTFGTLLGDSFTLAKAGAGEFAGIIAVSLAPGAAVLAVAAVMTGRLPDAESLQASVMNGSYAELGVVFLAMVLDKLCAAIAMVALTLAVDARDQGRALPVAEAYQEAFARLIPFAWAGLIVMARVCVGFLLLIVPGIILSLRYSLVHVVVLVEGRRGTDALKRSSALFGEHPGRVFGSALAIGMIVVVVSALVQWPMRLTGLFLPPIPLVKLAFGLGIELCGKLIEVWALALTVLLFKELAALHPEPAAAPPPAVAA